MIGTSGSAAKLAKLADLGLTNGVNYNEEDFAERVLAVTDGHGVDVVVDVVVVEVDIKVIGKITALMTTASSGSSSKKMDLEG